MDGAWARSRLGIEGGAAVRIRRNYIASSIRQLAGPVAKGRRPTISGRIWNDEMCLYMQGIEFH